MYVLICVNLKLFLFRGIFERSGFFWWYVVFCFNGIIGIS